MSGYPRNLARDWRMWTCLLPVVLLLFVGWMFQRLGDDSSTRRVPHPVSSLPLQPTPEWDVPHWDPQTPDVTWEPAGGIDLPVSQIAGPHCLTDTQAECFEDSDAGAALAAAHILVRTFAVVGSDSFLPTIDEQVIGDQKTALARVTQQIYDGYVEAAGVDDGAPLPMGDGWVVGYRFVGQGDDVPGQRTVQVLVMGADENLGFTQYTMDLEWTSGDWRAVAPRWGDWSQVAQAVQNSYPTSYRSYDDITANTEVTS